MEKFVIILLLATGGLQERSPKQIFLSAFNPYSYTLNSQPLSSQQFQYLGISPQISPLYSFWSQLGHLNNYELPQQLQLNSNNLHTEHQQPKVQWTSQLLPSAVQSQSPPILPQNGVIHLPENPNPSRFQAPLSTSSQYFSNIWNFDEDTQIVQGHKSQSNLTHEDLFSLHLGQNSAVIPNSNSAYSSHPNSHNTAAFQRGQVESRPQDTGNSDRNYNFRLPTTNYNGDATGQHSSGGFVRGHVESRPGNVNTYEQLRSPEIRHVTGSDSRLSFNRGAVEFSDNKELAAISPPHQNDHHNVPTSYQADAPKVVCYFASWAWYRKGKGSFVPENVDPTLCTHIMYAFARLDKAKMIIKMSDPWTDEQNGFYRRIVALKQKNPALKVILALGGWSDSGDDKYSILAHSPQSRPIFARESRDFLKSRGFDGLSLDWHYPKCWQSNCDAGPASDRTAFSDLIRELKSVFEPAGLLVSATLSGYKEVIDLAYDVPMLSRSLDLMNVMAYDYHGAWESRTGHVAPLYMGNPAADPWPHYNANYTMEYYVSLGADRSKLVLGVPMYGQSFQLENEGDAMVGSRSKGPGNPGEYTNQPGMLAYYEICKRVRNAGWQVAKDLTGSWGPYAHLRDQWVGFDDSEFLIRKSRFVKNQRYGGVFVWTLDLDDFRNECCRGTQPLLRTIAKEILGIPYDHTREDCTAPPEVVTPSPTQMTSTVSGLPPKPSTTTLRTTVIWWIPPPGSNTTTSQPPPTSTSISSTTEPSSTFSSSVPIPTTSPTPPETQLEIQTPPPRPELVTEPIATITTQTSTSLSSVGNNAVSTTSSTLLLICQQIALNNSNNNGPWVTPQPDWMTSTTTKAPSPVVVTEATRPTEGWSSTTIASAEQTTLTTVMPGETCDNAWAYKPDPTDCASYYQCVSGKVVQQRCPYGLHWNRYARACDWPQSAKCEDHVSVESTPSTTTTTERPWWESSSTTTQQWSTTTTYPPQQWSTTTAYPPQQTSTSSTTRPSYRECVPGEYYPAPNCDQYYLCNNGLKKLQSCGPGLHWDQRRKLCDWPKAAMCQQGIRMEDQHQPEQCQEGSYAGSKEDCEIYLVCVHGKFTPFRCQTGLHWNNNAKVCDWPQNAGCSLSGARPPAPPPDPEMTPEPGPPAPPPTSESWTTTSTTRRPIIDPAKPVTSQPSPATERPTGVVKPEDGGSKDFMIVCYFTNWAWYRQGSGKYKPENIDSNLCTHVVYGFAVLDPTELLIKPHDTWADYDNKFYEQVTALRSRGTKVTIAIGGWNDSLGDKYSRLVNNPAARRKFIQNVVDFIKKNNFDGLDLDWEYPKCWQVECDQGPASDKPSFAAFVRELSEAFKPHGLLLSSAVSPSKTVIDLAYEVPTLSRYLDWIAIMSYDYHGQWDKKTGHVAPLFFHDEDDSFYLNTNYTINYWIAKGADKRKLVMGMPLYGQSFTLSSSDNGLNAPTSGGGTAGEFTKAAGFLSYYEICKHVQKDGWTVVHDPTGAIGPYAYKGNQWVSYDDPAMIKKKSQLVRDLDIGGGMVWALDLEDFQNTCGHGRYPLLTTIKNVLSRPRDGIRKIPMREKFPNFSIETNKPSASASTPMQISVTSPQPQMTTTIAQNPHNQVIDHCDGEPFRPHTKDCRRYYQCLFGRYIEHKCPGGTLWNKDHCDWTCGTEQGSSGSGSNNNTPKPQPPPSTTRPTTRMTTTTQQTTMSTSTTQNNRPPPSVSSGTTLSPPPPRTTTEGWAWKPKLVTTTTINPVEIRDTEYKVVCYFTNWAWYRQGIGKYKPEDIDYNLCTHIAYGFAVLNPTTLEIKPHDSWADIDNTFYTQVTSLRSKGKKVVIAIGGWNDSAGDKYSRLIHDADARRKFIAKVIEFIDKWGFDGLDLDWEYPKCWQTDCKKGPDSDKHNFASFVKELSDAFKPKGLLLSSAVSPSKVIIEEGYDVPTVSKYLDWIAVMTYDYHGQWDKKTGHVAPLYHHEESDNFYFNTNYTIHFWLSQGADRKKIIMGMPMYGQSFSLADTSNTGLNSKSYGGGEAGEYTRAQGFLAYYEICTYVQKRGWTVVQDQSGAIGPYAYKGNQWVSFDDANMIRTKSEYIKNMGLGGAMIWALDLEDFRGVCGCEKHPLLKTINRVLRSYPDPDPHCKL